MTEFYYGFCVAGVMYLIVLAIFEFVTRRTYKKSIETHRRQYDESIDQIRKRYKDQT